MKEEYYNLSRFIDKAQERVFNDALMNVLITEIRLKSGNINEEMILPRYYNKGITYQGIFYERSAMIKDLLPKKAMLELRQLVAEASLLDFTGLEQIKNWIAEQTGITDCSLSVTDTNKPMLI